MQSQLNRLNNQLRKHQSDFIFLNGQKARLQSQLIILLQQNNSLRQKLSRSKISTNEQLKAENERLRRELEDVVNRSSAGAADEHLEELYREIDRLNLFIYEREGSYMQMMGEVEELRRNVEMEGVGREEEIGRVNEEMERVRKELAEREGEIAELKEEIAKSRDQFILKQQSNIIQRTNTSDREPLLMPCIPSNNDQLQQLKSQIKRLETQLDSTKNNTLSIQPTATTITTTILIDQQTQCDKDEEIPIIRSKKQSLKEVLVCDEVKEGGKEEEKLWKIMEERWETERRGFEEEIRKYGEVVEEMDSRISELQKDHQGKQYQMSQLSIELIQLKTKLRAITQQNIQLNQTITSTKKNNHQKVKAIKKELNELKEVNNDLVLINEKLNTEIKELKISVVGYKNKIDLVSIKSAPEGQKKKKNLQLCSKTLELSESICLEGNVVMKESLGKEGKVGERGDFVRMEKGKEYERWLILQGKIERIKEENKYLKYLRAMSMQNQ